MAATQTGFLIIGALVLLGLGRQGGQATNRDFRFRVHNVRLESVTAHPDGRIVLLDGSRHSVVDLKYDFDVENVGDAPADVLQTSTIVSFGMAPTITQFQTVANPPAPGNVNVASRSMRLTGTSIPQDASGPITVVINLRGRTRQEIFDTAEVVGLGDLELEPGLPPSLFDVASLVLTVDSDDCPFSSAVLAIVTAKAWMTSQWRYDIERVDGFKGRLIRERCLSDPAGVQHAAPWSSGFRQRTVAT